MPYQDVLNTMLPHRGNQSAHITGHYGEHRGKGPHGGSDFNYDGGQAGVNLTHPAIHSPIAGEVTFVGGQYGTIKIRDAEGNSHEILHTQSQSVKVGQHIAVGDEIGHMGGRGPDGATQYAQHVHYQMKDAQGRPVNPEQFWKDRHVDGRAQHGSAPTPVDTLTASHAVMREGARGAEVTALQERLNTLGITDREGHALKPDGHFGAHTMEAVEAFQHAQGLKADGIAGPRTMEALDRRQAPGVIRLDHASHPDHPLFNQARDAVHRLDAQQQRPPDQHSDNLAAALTVAAREGGMGRVDHAVLNDDASKTYAIQGDINSPFKQVAEVSTQQATQTPIAQSSEAWQQVAERQAAAPVQASQHAQPHQGGPSQAV